MSHKVKIPQNCTILRTMVITSYSYNIVTGEKGEESRETVTRPCDTPLFGEKNGICRACRSGWEVPENMFASEAEKKRATGEA